MAKNAKNKIAEIAGGKVTEKMKRALMRGNTTSVFIILICLALLNDFSDVLLIGSIPVLGDMFDAATSIILTAMLSYLGSGIKLKVRLLQYSVQLFEFIPTLDIFPFYTISVLWALASIKKRGLKAKKGLRKLENGEVDEKILKDFKG